MTQAQKIIKYLAIAMAFAIIIGIVGGCVSLAALIFGGDDDPSSYLTEEMNSEIFIGDITSLKIDIMAASLTLKTGETLTVETNSTRIKSSFANGVLTVKETGKRAFSYNGEVGSVVVTLPETSLKTVDITTGAGKVEIEWISTEKLAFEFGAGAVTVEQLYVSGEADVDLGAGKVTVKAGSITDLDIDMGVGEVDITAALKGDCDISCGVGTAKLTLEGDQSDYTVTFSKGLGNATMAGRSLANGTYGSGETTLDIEGGVGSLKIEFYVE